MAGLVIGGQELARRLAGRAQSIATEHGFQPNQTNWSFPVSTEGIKSAVEFGRYRAMQEIITELSTAVPLRRVTLGMSQAELRLALAQDTRVDVSTTEAAIYMGRSTNTLRSWAVSGAGAISPISAAKKDGRLPHMRWKLDDIRRALGEAPRQ